MISPSMYFDKDIVEYLKDVDMFWWRISWVYRSNWRILHIDGFEGGRRIPISMRKSIPWFSYAEDK
jgi:hypothetical protein